MASAWAMTDDTLAAILEAYRAADVDGQHWSMALFQNDYSPVPGDDESAYEEADFTGYSRASVDGSTFGSITVTDNIATTLSSEGKDFTVDSSFVGEQTIYGYFMLDADDNYIFGFRFENPRTLFAFDTLTVTPQISMGNFPYA